MSTYLQLTAVTTNTLTVGAIGSNLVIPARDTSQIQIGQIVRIINPPGAAGGVGQVTLNVITVDSPIQFTGRVLGGYPTDTGAGAITASGRPVLLMYDPDYQFCDANELVRRSACWDFSRLSDADREAITVYARVKSLAAQTDAPDYSSSLPALLDAANSWKMMRPENRQQLEAYEALLNANVNGAGLSADVNTLKTAAVTYETIPPELRKNVLAFLKCLLNSRGLSA